MAYQSSQTGLYTAKSITRPERADGAVADVIDDHQVCVCRVFMPPPTATEHLVRELRDFDMSFPACFCAMRKDIPVSFSTPVSNLSVLLASGNWALCIYAWGWSFTGVDCRRRARLAAASDIVE